MCREQNRFGESKKKKKSWIKKGSVEGLKEEVELLLQKGVMGSRREKIRK